MAEIHRQAATYLASDDPYVQSGMWVDADGWQQARRPILDAIDRDGTFLDVGCANGLLMESVATWAAANGRRIQPYGLDLSPALADRARQRLPRWADRIVVGNANDWRPDVRFDFVRTELVYAPMPRRSRLVDHLLTNVVAPGGRLVLCSYGSPEAEPIAEELRSFGRPPVGESMAFDADGIVTTRVAWLDAPDDGSPTG